MPNLPTLPAATMDTTYVAPTGTVRHVAAGGNLQGAINSSVPGDLITLEAGATFNGNYILPAKSGADYIHIQTKDFATPGRMTIAGAAGLAKIVATSGNAFLGNAGAHHFRFVGINTYSDGYYANDLIMLGSNEETVSANQPHHIILDRCYVHGDSALGGKRGVALQGVYQAIINSHLSDWKGIGQDTQAAAGWNGAGPFKLENNYLEGSGENVMFGGSDAYIPSLVPSDIEVRGNHFFKPLTWKIGDPSYAGIPWSVKNIFELKNAQRVLVENNIFENNWAHAQSGMSIVFTPRNSSNTNPWTVVQDITFRRNRILNVDGGMNLIGQDDIYPSQVTRRVLSQNNSWERVTNTSMALYMILYGVEDLTIDHDTADNDWSIIVADGIPHPRFTFTNNINRHNAYGIFGSGYGVGNACIAHYFPDGVFRRNIMIGANPSQYPTDNFYPATVEEVGFVDYPDNLELTEASPYYHQGTDGASPGVIPGDDVIIPPEPVPVDPIPMEPGKPGKSHDKANNPGKGHKFSIPNMAHCARSVSWRTEITGTPTTVAAALQGAMNDVEEEYVDLDSSTNTTEEYRTMANILVRFLRINLVTLSGGSDPTFTSEILI